MKKSIHTGLFILFAGVATFLTGCSEDSGNAPDKTTNAKESGSMTCSINGSAWTGDKTSFNHILNIDNTSGNQLIIDGTSGDNTRILLTANADAPGTFILDVGNNIINAGAALQIDEGVNRALPFINQAKITITKLDKANQKASGSFEFSSEDGKYTITGGTFTDLYFEIR